jgi:glycosyltransferase involved in cell wall biosynthesis
VKLAIISSYDRDCGIAQYVEHLEGPLRELLDGNLSIAPLPVDLLRASGPMAQSMAQKALAESLAVIGDADVVVVELEPGLFGRSQKQIWGTLRQIFDVSKRVVITYHTVPTLPPALPKSFRALVHAARHRYGQTVFRRLLRLVRSSQGKFAHIVQTRREKTRLTLMGIEPERIFDMPLSYFTRAEKADFDQPLYRQKLDAIYGTSDKKVLGVFGFLGGVKGTKVALRALGYLPPDHHILIVGGLHPETVLHGSSDQPPIRDIAALVEPIFNAGERPEADSKRADLLQRVHFAGAVDNRTFAELMVGCDAILLPYEEVGQTSSGPASQALDLQRPIYCTRTGAFRELGKYAKDALSFFEIGNHLELAQKIRRADAILPIRVQARARYADTVTVEVRAQMYIDAAKSTMPS